jgi:16S rRNA (guanine527-N7)-methyltransferase
VNGNPMDLLAETTAAWGLGVTQRQIDQLAAYVAELRAWNERVNLTAITGEREIVTRHFLDSLRLALSWGDPPASLIDIGAGAGFPGVPLKILRPQMRLTLVESVGKKAAFLKHLSLTLGLEEVQVITARAEAIGRDPQHREQYDLSVARAVADLRVLAEYCLPLCRIGGRLLAPKGARIDDEVQQAQHAITLLGGRIIAVEPVALPEVEPRTLVVIEKVEPTLAVYPRAPGVPARRPL